VSDAEAHTADAVAHVSHSASIQTSEAVAEAVAEAERAAESAADTRLERAVHDAEQVTARMG
jgi:hypothetical protein